MENCMRIENSEAINIAEYEKIKTIGTGTYGRVVFVKHKNSFNCFALKILKKAELIKMNQIDHIYSEYCILKELSHPFIVSLKGMTQDSRMLYFLLEYIPGGELFTLMRIDIALTPDHAQFYVAQLIQALDYLHSLNIIYRDLKPENILINSNGYIKLTDFGFAKKVDGKTYTICGTPEYLAPEVVLNKGYSKPADWWALGIITYEMVVGIGPFTDQDPMIVYQKIINGKIRFPRMMNNIMKSFIKHLLVGDTSKRMGCGKNGVNDVYEHSWFRNYEWDRLMSMAIPAWHVPKIKNSEDTSNYNDYPDSEVEAEEVNVEQDPFIGW